ncbi:MAG: integrin alpha, partial [Planctomycetota bacterium]
MTTALLPLAARATAQSTMFELVGANAGDRLGHAVAAAGDVNGDGYEDVIVGIPQEDTSGAAAGAARVISGSDGVLLYRLLGEAPGDAFGTSVAGAGDFDGDGLADVVVGAPGSDAGGANAGRASVFSGATGASIHTLTGTADNDLLGTAVASAGDVNGDGYGDIIVGAPQGPVPAVGPGYAVVCSGRDGTSLFVLTGDTLGDTFGASVSGTGDLDQDCRDDVIVGAPLDDFGVTSAGSAKVFAGRDGTLIRSFHGPGANDFCGHAVTGGGDVNSDGVPDVAIGSPGNDMSAPDAGMVQVFSGTDGALLHTFAGLARGDRLGWSVDCNGDVDGDGFADVVAGSPFRDTFAIDAGAATVHSGRDGSRLCSLDGRRFGDRCGFDVAFAGNVNRDGRSDVILGCPLEDSTAPDAGTARVFAGLPCRHTPAATVEPPAGSIAPGAAFGRHLAELGDLNGDGRVDFIVGAPGDSTQGRQGNGSAQIISGADQQVLFTLDGDADGDAFGSAVGSAGDVDGDGINDPIVGAPAAAAGAGMVRVFSGSDATVLHTIPGAAGDGLGAAVDRVSDLDGDGRSEFMAGAPLSSGTAGEVRIYAGDDARLLWAVAGAGPGQQLGVAARAIGDIDGDGLDDLALGGPAAGPTPLGPGHGRVVSGHNGTVRR